MAGLILSVLVMILLSFKCSSAVCDQGHLGVESMKDVLLQSDGEFVLGRKMLHKFDEKTVQTPGKSEPAKKNPNSSPEAEKGKNQVQTQNMVRFPKDVDSRHEKHEESEAFLEAADEVANLMRKDYHGMARRKPPINNHVPKD